MKRTSAAFISPGEHIPRWSAILLLTGFLLGSTVLPALNSSAYAAQKKTAALDVVINEVAWAGTEASGSDEWIELYNPTGVNINLENWQLIADDGSPQITFLQADCNKPCIIPAGGYFLLERTDDTTVSDISADLIYTGALENNGNAETLRLFDDSGFQVDTANIAGNNNWPAGDNPTKSSMERIAVIADSPSAWATNDGINRNGLDANGAPINGTPTNSGAVTWLPLDVIINEVAWAGTEAYFGDEWIELYNPTSQEISLEGWRIASDSGNVDFFILDTDITRTTDTNIPAGGYFLIERGIDGKATSETENMTYESGLLADTGETLRLLAPDRTLIDTANVNGGAWPAGKSAPPAGSMERTFAAAENDSLWVTNDGSILANGQDAAGNNIHGSPGRQNWGFGLSQTPTPTLTPSLSVMINEVAWAGTEASSSDEWIELYNHGSASIDLTGWRLTASDGAPDIALSGSIPPGGYFLLERTDDNAVADIPADQTYSGALSNDGETLKLLAPNNAIIDTANLDGNGWPAGNSANFGSMERNGLTADGPAAWFTNTGAVRNGIDADGNPINGTPKQPNWAISVTATASLTPTRTPIPSPTPSRTPTPYPLQAVILNEFLPRAGHDWNGDGIVDVNDEFIEIINRDIVPVNLEGWKLDDEKNSGSSPYALPKVNLEPGQSIAIFASTSHISLSDGGDTVRLLKANGQIADVITYSVVKTADRAWCRIPNIGVWNPDCFPTPNEDNLLSGDLKALDARPVTKACLAPDTLPAAILFAECQTESRAVWDSRFWSRNTATEPPVIITGGAKWQTWFH